MAAENRPSEMGQATKVIVDPGPSGTLRVTGHDVVFPLKSAGAETRTLPAPTGIPVGTCCSLLMDTDGGDITVTVTGGMNQSGHTSAVFADAGDRLDLMVISLGTTKRWDVTVNVGSVATS